MKTSLKKFLLIAFIISFPILSAEKRKIIIQWEKVPTAERYTLEIRNSEKQIIFRKDTLKNSQEVELELGEYEKKIYVINKLDEVESESDWESFKVSLIQVPELRSQEKIFISKDTQEVLLEGKNFHPEMLIKLRKGEKIYILEKSKVQDSNTASLVMNPEIPEGEYDLILENPKKSRTYPNLISKEKQDVERQSVKEEESHVPKSKKWEIVKRSALLSGWGEYYAGNIFENKSYDFRGKLYFGSFVTFTLLYLYFNEFTLLPGSKTPTQKNFELDTTRNFSIAFLMPNLSNNSRRIAALYGLNEMNRQAELVNQQSQRVNLMLLFMAGIYVTQLVDAFFIERNEISSLNFEQPKFQFSLTSLETQKSFHLQFDFKF